MQQHLVLVDGHHLMYRAFYAIPQTFKTHTGELTNAVYGVNSMLLSMLRLEQPDAMLFCFDEGEKTFRHQENATYKEGRAETPDGFYDQIPRIMRLIDAFGIARESDPGFEADDLLCAYAKEGEKAGMRVTIVTGDRDAFQLATPNIRISIPHKGYQQPEYLGPSEILAKYGIRPDQVASYKGLCGDASDNLPGVKGIGPKTAADLLQRFDTLTGVYEHLDQVKPAVRAKLEADRDQAFFCERMARLVCLPLKRTLQQLSLQDLSLDAARSAMRELEFLSLLSRLETIAKSPYGLAHFKLSEIMKEQPKVKEPDQLSLF
jgi:DNA polymerase I